MKKILLTLLVSFIGIFNVKASGIIQNTIQQKYTNLKGLYYDMAILNCYDLKVINNTVADNKKSDLALECINKFKGNGAKIDNEADLKKYYNARSSLGNTLAGLHNVDIIDGLNGNNTFDSKLKSAQAELEAAAKLADALCRSNCTYESQYKEIVTSTSTYFNSICEYLKAHEGIRSYIKMIINIVCYGALAAGIILGIMDFVMAIASHEDAALTKAFQSFMKRVVAIALIFLSNVFVTLILNVVQRNEYLDHARENATCVTDSLIKVK